MEQPQDSPIQPLNQSCAVHVPAGEEEGERSRPLRGKRGTATATSSSSSMASGSASSRGRLIPDFVLAGQAAQQPHGTEDAASTSAVRQPATNNYYCVGEAKQCGKLFPGDHPVDLVGLFNDSGNPGHNSVRFMLQQLYVYMVITRVQFGFLSCYCCTWLAWRSLEAPNCLQLSGPYLQSSSSPDVTSTGALSWMQDQALRATKHSCWAGNPPVVTSKDPEDENPATDDGARTDMDDPDYSDRYDMHALNSKMIL
jgi:hypothetical protein